MTVCARQPPREDLGEAVEQERKELVRVILRAHVRIKREEARGFVVAPAGGENGNGKQRWGGGGAEGRGASVTRGERQRRVAPRGFLASSYGRVAARRYSRLNKRERVVGQAAAAECHGCEEQLKGGMRSGVRE